jgi:3-hydroxyisobutyrate dehydrogenase
MTSRETIAVLGAGGTMGLPMTHNLARVGFIMRAWNRSPEKAQSLVGDGVQLCSTPAEAVRGATVIITMLSDADAVLDVMKGDDGALATSADRAIWLQMSTIGIEGTERCEELAAQQRLQFVDAPVLGTKGPAQQGELVVLASGLDELCERLAPVFDVVGKRTLWVGEAGAGTRLKMAINTWILSVVEGAAETLALAEGMGLDPSLVLEAVAGGPLDLPYLQMKGKAMIERSFEPAFKLALAAKDARLVQDAAAAYEVDLPLVTAIAARLEEGVAKHGAKDMSATFLTSMPDTGDW